MNHWRKKAINDVNHKIIQEWELLDKDFKSIQYYEVKENIIIINERYEISAIEM